VLSAEIGKVPLLCHPRVGMDFVLMQVDSLILVTVVLPLDLLISNIRIEWAHTSLLHGMQGYRLEQASDAEDIPGLVLTTCLNLWQGMQSDCTRDEACVVEIDSLLQLSRDLKLQDDEMTPVQVWNIIRTLPVSECINATILGQITAELCCHLKYHR
jgi:hypothetical protein